MSAPAYVPLVVCVYLTGLGHVVTLRVTETALGYAWTDELGYVWTKRDGTWHSAEFTRDGFAQIAHGAEP